jgi:excisionase family DNA binding protein
MMSDLLDVEEAANFCHVKTATVRDWILKGKIAYVKLGRRVFLRREVLEELIAASVVPARQPRGGIEPAQVR